MADATYNLNGGFKPTIKRLADLEGPDFYPTPAWATHALIESEGFEGEIWEPACGDGAMSSVLAETGNPVVSSDLYDRGFGEIASVMHRPRRLPSYSARPSLIMLPAASRCETMLRTICEKRVSDRPARISASAPSGAKRSSKALIRSDVRMKPPSAALRICSAGR